MHSGRVWDQVDTSGQVGLILFRGSGMNPGLPVKGNQVSMATLPQFPETSPLPATSLESDAGSGSCPLGWTRRGPCRLKAQLCAAHPSSGHI